MASALLLISVVLSSVSVGGTSRCPTAAEVERRLAALRPGEPTDGPTGHRAVLSSAGNKVRVELVEPSGAVVSTRVLEATAPCPDLAAACAVIIAAWEAELRSTSSIPSLPPAAPPPADEPVAVEPAPPPPRPAREEPPVALEVGMALTASLATGGVAIGGTVGLAVVGRQGGWGGSLGLGTLGSRGVVEGSNALEWERYAARLGPLYRLHALGLRIDLQVEALLALLVTSVPFADSSALVAFDPGLGVGARAVTPLGLWFGVSAAGWLFQREVGFASGAPYPLVRQELLLAVGFTGGGL